MAETKTEFVRPLVFRSLLPVVLALAIVWTLFDLKLRPTMGTIRFPFPHVHNDTPSDRVQEVTFYDSEFWSLSHDQDSVWKETLPTKGLITDGGSPPKIYGITMFHQVSGIMLPNEKLLIKTNLSSFTVFK